MRRVCTLALLPLLLSTTAHALRIDELARLGPATGRSGSPEVRVAALEGSGFVAAWTGFDENNRTWARARIFDAEARRVGKDVYCVDPGSGFETFRARVAPLGSGFMLGCDVIVTEPTLRSIVRLRPFTANGEEAGNPIEIDTSGFLTQLESLTEHSTTSVVANLDECRRDPFDCGRRHRIVGIDGSIGDPFPVRIGGWRSLQPLDGPRYLGLRFGNTDNDGKATLYTRRLSDSGTALEERRKLARIPVSPSWVEVTRGMGGRISIKWDTVGRLRRTTHVQLFDADGNALWDAGTVVAPPFTDNHAALPSEYGFLLVSVVEDRFTVQSFADAGFELGPPTTSARRPNLVESVTWLDEDQAYVIGGIYQPRYPKPGIARLWRISFDNRCGDVVGDEVMDYTDVRIIRDEAEGKATVCLDCICDLDGSGSVDATDVTLAEKAAFRGVFPLGCPRCD